MTLRLLDPLGGSEDAVSHPLPNLLPGGLSGCNDGGVFGVGESDTPNVPARVVYGGSPGSGGHEVDYTGHVKSLTGLTLEATISDMTSTTLVPNSAATSAAAEPTRYEVVWGREERDRTVRIDYHDGSVISEAAEWLATKVFLEMCRVGARVGFYVDGVLKTGQEPVWDDDAVAVEHRTRTYQRRTGERYVTKSNGSCGRWRPENETTWVCSCGNGGFGRNNDRADARSLAKRHREDPAGFPGRPWASATVTYVPVGAGDR